MALAITQEFTALRGTHLPPASEAVRYDIVSTYTSSACVVTSIALTALGCAFPPLFVVGLTCLTLSLMSFAVSLTFLIQNKKREHALMLLLKDLKFTGKITPEHYLEIRHDLSKAALQLPDSPLTELATHRDLYYQQLNEKILALAASLNGDISEETLTAAYTAFTEFLTLHLKDDFDDEEEQKAQVASFNQSWRKVNDAFERVVKRGSLHLTCGCHLATAGATLPHMDNHVIDGLPRYTSASGPYSEVDKKTILLFTSKAGAGNVTVTKGVAEALKRGYHIDIAPTESEFEAYFYNEVLVRPQRWGLLRFLMKLFAHSESSITQKFAPHVRHHINLVKPDVIVTASPQITRACYVEGCVKERLPLVALATDFDGQDFVHFLPHHPERVKMGIPHGASSVRETLHDKIAPEDVHVIGYPVPSVFKENHNPLEIRRNMNEALGLSQSDHGDLSITDDTAPITAIMMGSLGCSDLIETYTDKFIQMGKISPLFLCCGSNKELYNKLRAKYARYPFIHVLPRLSQEAIAKLYSTLQLLITKPGGATIAEALTKKVPLLLDDTDTGKAEALYWESSNVRFVQEQGLGQVLKDPADFAPHLERMLSQEKSQEFELEDFTIKLAELIETVSSQP